MFLKATISHFTISLCLITILSTRAFRLFHPRMAKSQSALNIAMKPILTKLIDKQSLTSAETEEIWKDILKGADPIQVGALLVLLRAKGETAQEIAGMVRAMKSVCIPVNALGKLLDIVGTGGDGADTINISTAAVILAAACGCRVAKAGNRSASSKCGSADVLERLGIQLELTPEQVIHSIEHCGIGFMYAPINHPSMKTVSSLRKSLGIRTAFNLLGPITNAANAQHAVIGVFSESLVDLIAESLIELGHIEHAVVVHSCGVDEITAIGPTTVYEVKNIAPVGSMKKYITKRFIFDPTSVGIPLCDVEELKGGDVDMNAEELRLVLTGNLPDNPKRNSVILNTGFGVYVYGLVPSIAEGIKLARKVLDSGEGLVVLDKWISSTQKIVSLSASATSVLPA